MGHKRFGDLPNTGGWKRFKRLLGEKEVDADVAAEAALEALTRRLPLLKDDPGLCYSFWLLSQIVWSARRSDYYQVLREVGIDTDDPAEITSPLAFISKVADSARREIDANRSSTVFSNIAQLALRETLTRLFTERAPSLLEMTADDVQSTCKQFATTRQFGRLSTRFFGTYLTRLLQYFVEREVPSHVGPGKRFSVPEQVDSFRRRVAYLCELRAEAIESTFRERAEIVDSFAGGFASLHEYRGDLSLNRVSNTFIPRALEKLKAELERSRATDDNRRGPEP